MTGAGVKDPVPDSIVAMFTRPFGGINRLTLKSFRYCTFRTVPCGKLCLNYFYIVFYH